MLNNQHTQSPPVIGTKHPHEVSIKRCHYMVSSMHHGQIRRRFPVRFLSCPTVCPALGSQQAPTHPLAGNLNPSPTAPQPSVSRFRSGFSRNTQLDVAQPATAFPAVDERTSHFHRHGDLMMPPRDHDLLASNPASHRSSDLDISRQSTRDTQVPHQLSDEREQRSQPRHQLRDEPAQLPHYPPALPAVSHRRPDLRGDNVFDLKTSDQGRLQPAQREPAFVRVESEKEVFLPEKDSHAGKLMLTDLPRHLMSEDAKLTAAVSKVRFHYC